MSWQSLPPQDTYSLESGARFDSSEVLAWKQRQASNHCQAACAFLVFLLWSNLVTSMQVSEYEHES